MAMYNIYCYENKINGKIYIGFTNNIIRRDKEHSAGYYTDSSLIEKSIQKYGRDNFDLK